jgi:hypothetical protein
VSRGNQPAAFVSILRVSDFQEGKAETIISAKILAAHPKALITFCELEGTLTELKKETPKKRKREVDVVEDAVEEEEEESKEPSKKSPKKASPKVTILNAK